MFVYAIVRLILKWNGFFDYITSKKLSHRTQPEDEGCAETQITQTDFFCWWSRILNSRSKQISLILKPSRKWLWRFFHTRYTSACFANPWQSLGSRTKFLPAECGDTTPAGTVEHGVRGPVDGYLHQQKRVCSERIVIASKHRKSVWSILVTQPALRWPRHNGSILVYWVQYNPHPVCPVHLDGPFHMLISGRTSR